jgi:transposase
MDSMLILFFAVILIVGVALFALITALSKKGKTQLDVTKYRSRWLKIEQQLVRDNPTSYQMAILEADKLLDAALKERRLPGETMGERMKSAQKMWANANNVWTAHKIRNQIAHETDIKLSYDASRRALSAYKQGLKDLGAI